MAECFLSLHLDSQIQLSEDQQASFTHNINVRIHATEAEQQSLEFEVGTVEMVHVCVEAASVRAIH